MKRKLVDSRCFGGTVPNLGEACGALALSLAILCAPGGAAELADAVQLFRTGKYAECVEMAATEISDGAWQEEWRLLKARAELTQGNFAQAEKTIEGALDIHPFSLPLRLLAREVYLYNGKQLRAEAVLSDLERFVTASPRRYRSPAERVALGRFLLQRGADARHVLELVYDQVREQAPNFVDVYLASAELALDKNDFGVAAETLRSAPEEAAADPRYHFLLARAYASDDPAETEKALTAALEINPLHADSLLLRADQLIDAEQYTEAEKVLEEVFRVNLQHPKAWAYKAVLAHLTGDADTEREARGQALASWSTNPEVDHLIGRKLSQKYRFAEGAAYQRRALALDESYRLAKIQLSQDLLRLGEEEGWRLADEVADEDAYDVVAYNLVTLQQELAKFRTLERDGLLVRMESREAELYGERVLDLLTRARKTLCNKYDVELPERIIVEIYPQEKDFAVRTFGMPGISGFLGVCFGRVITANSPASQGDHPSNWEAVLWHEFCHVVTLQKTRNKMPRWLSEGISVYEERQADPTWGQPMTPQYREMILADELTPVSQLSSAFLAPQSPLHLQFAYFESSLVVEYLVDNFGLDALLRILEDLHDGTTINEALIRYTVPLGQLDADFAVFARTRAEALAPEATWDKPELPPSADAAALTTLLEGDPNNYWALQRLAFELLREDKLNEALIAAERLRELFPEDSTPESAHVLLARIHRELDDVEAERAALEELVDRDADATDAYLRLMQLGEEREDWQSVAKNARRMLAVNPLIPAPHRSLARAAEHLGERGDAIKAYRALLQFETTDPAEVHFRLATLLREEGDREQATRQALMALEEAPRYLAAHQLLLELVEDGTATNEREHSAIGDELAAEDDVEDEEQRP